MIRIVILYSMFNTQHISPCTRLTMTNLNLENKFNTNADVFIFFFSRGILNKLITEIWIICSTNLIFVYEHCLYSWQIHNIYLFFDSRRCTVYIIIFDDLKIRSVTWHIRTNVGFQFFQFWFYNYFWKLNN